MRQIFTSPRLETVEGVAKLLNEHGIETYVSGDRSYKGNRRGTFSYARAGKGEPQPAVWIVLAADQTRARQLLREAGLIESSRPGASGPQPPNYEAPRRRNGSAWTLRVRLLLLAAIAGMTLLVLSRVF